MPKTGSRINWMKYVKSGHFPKWNKYSFFRAASLFLQGKTERQVVNYYLKKYGEQWGIHSYADMKAHLFESSPSGGFYRRPDFPGLAGISRRRVLNRYQKWIAKNSATNARLAAKRTGRAHSAETLRKLSIRFRGTGNPMFGRTHSLEARQRMAEPHKGKVTRGFTGRKHTENFRTQQRKRMTGSANPFFGKKHTSKARETIGTKNRQRFEGPAGEERRTALSRRKKKFYSTSEGMNVRERISAARRREAAIRRYERIRHFLSLEKETARDARLGSTVVLTTKTPVSGAIRNETIRLVRQAVEALPTFQRIIIEQIFFNEKQAPEVAHELGKPLPIVEAALRNGLATLSRKKILESLTH